VPPESVSEPGALADELIAIVGQHPEISPPATPSTTTLRELTPDGTANVSCAFAVYVQVSVDPEDENAPLVPHGPDALATPEPPIKIDPNSISAATIATPGTIIHLRNTFASRCPHN
jgi:hypothetical protein